MSGQVLLHMHMDAGACLHCTPWTSGTDDTAVTHMPCRPAPVHLPVSQPQPMFVSDPVPHFCVQIIIALGLLGTSIAQVIACAADMYYIDKTRSKRWV